MATVWKIVDDTNSDVIYSGDWASSTGDGDLVIATLNSYGVTGSVFNNTLHQSRNANGIFSFKFIGTSRFAVYGAASNVFSMQPPFTATCEIDGKEVALSTIQSSILSYQQICEYDGTSLIVDPFQPGEHTLTVNMTAPEGSGFYLDYIIFETIPNASVDGDKLEFGNPTFDTSKDPHLEFSTGWTKNTTTGIMSTSTPGSNVTVKFNGTQIQLYGEISPSDTNTGTFQVDTQPPQQFLLFATKPLSNQMLFNISSLQPGEHLVVVTFTGQPDKTPLAIDWFQVTSLTAAEQARLAAPSPLSNPHHMPLGAIVGGAIGGLVLIALITVLLWAWTKKRHSRRPTTETITPFQSEKVLELSNPPSNSYNTEVNQIRFQNLKLQQRLALSENQPNQPRNQLNQEASQSLAVAPVVHTDSGWRMGNEDQGNTADIPPAYTTT